MARSHGKIKIEIWDAGSDFRALSSLAQWAYAMLVSQPGVTMCGVLAYSPKKWAKLARDVSLELVEEAIGELEAAWYVVVDRDSDELLIRTFIRHDEPWKLPNLVKAARRQWREIDSQVIRDYLAERHTWLVEPLQGPEKDWKESIGEYEKERASERASERTLPLPFERASGLRARTRTPTATATTTATTTAAEDQEHLEPKLDTSREEPAEPAAADLAEPEAPRESRVAEVVAALPGRAGDETSSLNQIMPLALQLPAEVFEEVAATVLGRRGVENPRGLLRWLLANEAVQRLRDVARSMPNGQGARAYVLPDPPPDLEGFVRDFAPRWGDEDFAEAFEVWEVDDDERIRLIDLASDLRREQVAG